LVAILLLNWRKGVKLIGLSKLIGEATGLLKNLHETYIEADSVGKRRLISSIYPQKLTFHGIQHRTVRMNEALRVLGTLKAVIEGKKKGQTKQKFDLPTMVAVTGQFSKFFLSDLQELAKIANYFKIEKLQYILLLFWVRFF